MDLSELIFIVEDDLSYASVLERALKNKGFTNIKKFSRGEECLEELDKKPSLILLDFSLEGLNGLDTLREIKKRSSQVRIVILTALESDEMKNACLREGADKYIVKNEGAFNDILALLEKPSYSGILKLFLTLLLVVIVLIVIYIFL